MPTMKEIAEALRDASVFAYKIKSYYLFGDGLPRSWEAGECYDKFKNLATQVEQMRCETCRWWDKNTEQRCRAFIDIAREDWRVMFGCGPNFGCWHWEEKDVNNEK